jgi:peptidylprolyl isomerase
MRVRVLTLVLPLLIVVACSSGNPGPMSSAAVPGTAASGSAAPATVVADAVPADRLPIASGGFGDKPTLTFRSVSHPAACNGLCCPTRPAGDPEGCPPAAPGRHGPVGP